MHCADLAYAYSFRIILFFFPEIHRVLCAGMEYSAIMSRKQWALVFDVNTPTKIECKMKMKTRTRLLKNLNVSPFFDPLSIPLSLSLSLFHPEANSRRSANMGMKWRFYIFEAGALSNIIIIIIWVKAFVCVQHASGIRPCLRTWCFVWVLAAVILRSMAGNFIGVLL